MTEGGNSCSPGPIPDTVRAATRQLGQQDSTTFCARTLQPAGPTPTQPGRLGFVTSPPWPARRMVAMAT